MTAHDLYPTHEEYQAMLVALRRARISQATALVEEAEEWLAEQDARRFADVYAAADELGCGGGPDGQSADHRR